MGGATPRNVAIGVQNFEDLIVHQDFYVDKTGFIKEWWENRDAVTLITRPRRFGKTLTMDMVEKFFSIQHAGKEDLFEGLAIWRERGYRELQGTYPVIALSFSSIKEISFLGAKNAIYQVIERGYGEYDFLLESDRLSAREKQMFQRVSYFFGMI